MSTMFDTLLDVFTNHDSVINVVLIFAGLQITFFGIEWYVYTKTIFEAMYLSYIYAYSTMVSIGYLVLSVRQTWTNVKQNHKANKILQTGPGNCPICMEHVHAPCPLCTTCKTMYHDTCFKQWIHSSSNKACVVCRQKTIHGLTSHTNHTNTQLDMFMMGVALLLLFLCPFTYYCGSIVHVYSIITRRCKN